MQKFLSALAIAAIASASIAPVSAQPLRADTGLQIAADTGITAVQYRRHGGPHYGGRPNYGGRGGYRGRGYNRGAAVGAGIAGLAVGALIAGAIANSQQGNNYAPADGDPEAYCAQRFKSYDPDSGTYLGTDRRRHPCP